MAIAFEFLHGMLANGDNGAVAAADAIATCHGWAVIDKAIALLEQDDALETEQAEILELAYMLRSARGRLTTSAGGRRTRVEHGRKQQAAEEAG